MVNNSTNIIKTNLSSQLSEHNKKTTTYDNGNPGSGLGQAQICGRVKLVNGLPIISCTQWKKPLLANSPKARREQIWRVRLCKNSDNPATEHREASSDYFALAPVNQLDE